MSNDAAARPLSLDAALAQERFRDVIALCDALPDSPRLLWQRGLALRGIDDLAGAAGALSRAAQVQETDVARADCLIDLALTHTRQGAVDKAREVLEQAHPVYAALASDMGLCKCEFVDCVVATRQGRYSETVPRLLDLAGRFAMLDAPSWQVGALALASNGYLLVFELDKAVTVIERARPLARQHQLAFRLGQLDYQAAWIAQEQGDVARARSLLAQSREACAISGARLLEADLRLLEANLHLVDGDVPAAERAHEHAARIYLTVGYRDGAAVAYASAGQLQRERGAVAEAIHSFQSAIALGAQGGEGRAYAFAQLLLGSLYRAIRLHPAARVALGQALDYFSTHAIWPAAAQAATELALVASPESLADAVQLALILANRCGVCAPRALAQRTLGEVLAQLGRLDEARSNLRESADYFRQTGYDTDWMASELALLEISDMAPEDLCAKLDVIAPHSRGIPDHEARILILRARAHESLGRMQAALGDLRLACDSMALIRVGVADIVLSAQLSAVAEQFFVEAIALALRLGDAAAVLDLCEYRRSHWLRRMVVSGATPLLAVAHGHELDAVSKAFRDLQLAVRAARDAQMADVGGQQAQKAIAEAQARAQAARAAYDRVNEARFGDMRSAERHTPDVAQGGQRWADLEVEALRERFTRLYGSAWTAVSINPLDQKGQRWVTIVLTPDGFQRRVLTASPRIAFFLDQLTRTDDDAVRVVYAGAPGRQSLEVVAAWLGVDTWVQPADTLRPVLVADTDLFARLPFCALPVHGGRLVQHAAVRYCPSWEIALALADAGRLEPVTGQAALLAAPVEFPAPHPALPATSGEITAIAGTLARAGVEVQRLVGMDATVERLRRLAGEDALGRFDILHFAAHGVYLPEYPRMNGISLRDGHLTLQDILGWRLRARLVSISACDGGRRVSAGGADEIGLDIALHAAGARHVLSSLWRQADSRSALLMARFFERYAAQPEDARDAAQALAEAQREQASDNTLDWAGWRVSGP